MRRGLNAKEVLENVLKCEEELQAIIAEGKAYGVKWDSNRHKRAGYSYPFTTRCVEFRTYVVCDELSIFDWWKDTLSMSQLKQMERFLKQAISLGFTGYACFKVGSKGCSHGMWAHTNPSEDGYSPKTGDCIYHSFRCDENYYSLERAGEWSHNMNLKQVKEALKS